ncbi:MAG: recombinase family protein [Bacteroidota bacterium]
MPDISAISLERVSDQSQRDNTSIDAQYDINRRVAAERGYVIVHRFSEVRSGRKGRDSVEQAYDYAKQYNKRKSRSKQIQLLIIYDWSRWFRNVDLSGYWKTRFREIGVEVNSATQWEDQSHSGGIILRSVQMAMAEAESVENSKRTHRGIYYTIQKGYYAGRAPWGYVKINELDENGRRRTVQDEHKAEMMRQAFEMIRMGKPVDFTYAELGGSKTLGSRSSFHERIKNPIYAGRYFYKSSVEGLPDLAVTLRLEPILSWSDFQEVQSILKGRKHSRHRKQMAKHEFYLRSAIRCPECGDYCTSERSKGRSKIYRYYRCRSHPKHYRVSANAAHKFMENVMRGLQLKNEAAMYMRELYETKLQEFKANMSFGLNRYKVDLRKADERAERALEMYVDGKINSNEYAGFRDRADEIRAKLAQDTALIGHQGTLMSRIYAVLSDLGNIYARLTPIERGQLARVVFPEGFVLPTEKTNDLLTICRTARFNSIIIVNDCKSIDTGLIRTDLQEFEPVSPVLGE